MRRAAVLLVLVALFALLVTTVTAQPGDNDDPIPTIGILGLLGVMPADFGIRAVVAPDSLIADLQADYADTVAMLAAIPASRGEDGAFILGDPTAPVTIIEFADWACPHCQRYHPEILQLIAEHVVPGDAALEFRIFPTAGGDMTVLNGSIAECLSADNPSNFWAASVYLYALAETDRYDMAQAILPGLLNVDEDVLGECLNTAQQVETDIAYGQTHFVGGTPAVLVRYTGETSPSFITLGEQTYNQGGVPLDVMAQIITAAQ